MRERKRRDISTGRWKRRGREKNEYRKKENERKGIRIEIGKEGKGEE